MPENFNIISNHFIDVKTPIIPPPPPPQIDVAADVDISGNDVSVAGGDRIPLIAVGEMTDDIQVTDTEVTGSANSIAAVLVATAGAGTIAMSGTTGTVDAPEFINNSGAPIDLDGNAVTQPVGPAVHTESGRWNFADLAPRVDAWQPSRCPAREWRPGLHDHRYRSHPS